MLSLIREVQEDLMFKNKDLPVIVQKEEIEELIIYPENVVGTDYDAEVVQQGLEGQVSTIFGTGVPGQTDMNMDHPRKLQVASNGDIYFIDGNHVNAKLRKFDGRRLSTVVDLMESKVLKRDGYVWTTGLAIINNQIYLGTDKDLFKVVDGRLHQLSPKIQEFIEDNRLDTLYRMRKQGEQLYLMFKDKNGRFIIAEYNFKEDVLHQLTNLRQYAAPYQFYVDKNKHTIYVATAMNMVVVEELFPRKTLYTNLTNDSRTTVSDIFLTKDNKTVFVSWSDNVANIWVDPHGDPKPKIYVGNYRGYIDGFYDEVQMDNPLDFVWDGSGYLFADPGNHVIRKLWMNSPPREDL